MNPPKILILFVLSFASLRAQDFDAVRARVFSEAIPKLEVHAEWARSQKLFREAVRIWALVLRYAPEHPKARQFLRFTRQKDGTWKQAADFREPPNVADEKAIAECDLRTMAIIDPVFREVFAAFEERKDAMDEASKARALKELLVLDPRHKEARSLFLGTRRGKPPSMDEAATFKAALKEAEEAAAKLLADVPPPEKYEPTELEQTFGIRWSQGAATRNLSVLGTGDPLEAKTAAIAAEAAPALTKRLWGDYLNIRRGLTIHLLAGGGEREAFLAKCPGIEPAMRKLAEGTGGVWAGPSRVADWSEHKDRRIDGAIRQTIATLLMDAYGITNQHAWAEEGLGIYLTFLLNKTRLTWLVQPPRYAVTGPSLRKRLVTPGADWLSEARRLLDAPGRPTLERVLTVDVTTMIDDELVIAYALSACLATARPSELPAFLKAIGSGNAPPEAVKSCLDQTIEELDAYLRAWLRVVTS